METNIEVNNLSNTQNKRCEDLINNGFKLLKMSRDMIVLKKNKLTIKLF